jgi:hypothetical protein
MHIGLLLGGEKDLNMVYQELMAALKARAEVTSSQPPRAEFSLKSHTPF